MRELLLVGSGSFIGGASRYYLGVLILQHFGAIRFPLSTLFVNVLGCFLIGVVGSVAELNHQFTQAARLFLLTGILGGFTTFSAFSFETFHLMRSGELSTALLNVVGSLLLCLIATWVGFRSCSQITGIFS